MPDHHNQLRELARGVLNGACPLDGLVTAGQPTEDELAAFAAAGVRTVLDLRPSTEDHGFAEPEAVRRLGMTYVAVPVTPETLTDAQFDDARAVLRDPANHPVLLHCRAANRVGALLFPFLVLDAGHEQEAAFDLACAVGLRSAGYAERATAYIEARR